MLDRLLQSLHQELSTTIQDIIRLQLENIKMLLHLLPETAILDLPEDQYYVLSTISSYFGPNDGDLAQLPLITLITGQPVFQVQMGNISAETWQMLNQKHSEFLSRSAINTLLNTINIDSFRENAQQINRMICNILPVPEGKFFISQDVNSVNSTS
ncbi:15981_t:CDS:2 [Funneliformis geosporum]|uniref:15981_t:CDS:1 n=1 Tax=Funneliformis geosporum TaxID=1117311 RepID=A0A9W4SUP4_9GLOM|nr:15981_t:CDS:2 [Funneliformis geosporum]